MHGIQNVKILVDHLIFAGTNPSIGQVYGMTVHRATKPYRKQKA